LEKQRAVYEKYNVFSPAMIDGIIKKLKDYDDSYLRAEVELNPEAMLNMVRKYFHCG
jgi:glutamine synthetase